MRKILYLSFLLSLPLTCFANNFNYNYLEGGLRSDTIGRYTDTGKRAQASGGYLSGSWGFTDSAYVFSNLTYAAKNIKFSDYGYDYDGLGEQITTHQKATIAYPEIGLGLHRPINNFDILAEASYIRADRTFKEDEKDEEGEISYSEHSHATDNIVRLSAGMRAHMLQKMDGWLKVGYMNSGDKLFHHLITGVVGTQYHFNDMWSLVAQVDLNPNSTHWNIGARAQF